MNKTYYAYIMSNKSRRVYGGSTSELQPRVFKHKNGWYEDSFTARYNFDMLVYFETFSHPSDAIAREKEIKGWRREKKLRLVVKANPDWADLSAGEESLRSSGSLRGSLRSSPSVVESHELFNPMNPVAELTSVS